MTDEQAPTVSDLLTHRRDELSQEFIDDTESRLEDPVVLRSGDSVPLGDATLEQLEEDHELFDEAEKAQGEAAVLAKKVAKMKSDAPGYVDAQQEAAEAQVKAWDAQLKVARTEKERKEATMLRLEWQVKLDHLKSQK